MRVRLIAFFMLCWACNPISDYPATSDSPRGGGASDAGGVRDAGSVLDMDAGEDVAADADGPQVLDAGDVDAGAGDAGDAGDAAFLSDAAGNANDAGCRVESSDGGIPGVTIQVEGDRCSFPYGQGGAFRYRVTLDRALPYSVAAGSSCGFCGKYGADAESLVLATVVGAGGASYCASCDVGCCPPDRAGSYALSAQSLNGTLDWPAKSWSGPSDTNAPLGASFPPGASSVIVSLVLPDGRRAVAALPITIE
jgi:hypothetical protein